MADTILDDFSESICADCGKKGCDYRHWGPLVPPGSALFLCLDCWNVRGDYYNKHGVAKPITYERPNGTSPPRHT